MRFLYSEAVDKDIRYDGDSHHNNKNSKIKANILIAS